MYLQKGKISLISLGFTSILCQLVILKEFLNVFEGNELIIGLFLTFWMVFTALGSLLAGKSEKIRDGNFAAAFLLLVSCLAFAEIILLFVIESWLFPPGTEKGPLVLILLNILILFPACFVAGMVFTIMSADISKNHGKNRISQAYGLESAGSIIAGILFSTGFAYFMSSFQLLAIAAVINLILFLWIVKNYQSVFRLVSATAFVSAFVTIMLFSENSLSALHLRNAKIVFRKDTPYGNISVSSSMNQYNIYLNSRPLLYGDEYFAEEPVHFVLLQHKNPRRVLIVSGGMQSVKESLKYPAIKSVDYLEINPWLQEVEELFSDSVSDERVKILKKDARLHIKESTDRYDAVVINIPDPSSAQVNRFFTKEFFREARNAMHPNGILGISLSSTGNYFNKESLVLHGIIAETLSREFLNVTLIPGQRNYFIASDLPLTTRIAGRVIETGINNVYVNPFYVDDDLTRQRSNEILLLIKNKNYPVNSDLFPVAYFTQIGHWMRITEGKAMLPVFIMVFLLSFLVVLILVLKKDKAVYAVFSSSFAGASAGFLLIFLYQVLLGNLYQMIGIMIACYMGGLYAGTTVSFRRNRLKYIDIMVQCALVIFLLLLPLLAYIMVNRGFCQTLPVQMVLFCLTAAIAFSAGMVFNVSTRTYKAGIERTAGIMYGIDLAGSAAGSLLTSIILLPLFGLIPACLVITGFVILSVLISLSQRFYGV